MIIVIFLVFEGFPASSEKIQKPHEATRGNDFLFVICFNVISLCIKVKIWSVYTYKYYII